MTMKDMSDLRPLLEAEKWFGQLPAGFREQLLRQARLISLEAGQTVFRRGDGFDGIYCVARGTVALQLSRDDGQPALLHLLTPLHWFGELGLFDHLPRSHDAVAEQASTLLHIDQTRLQHMLNANPGWWQHLGLLVAGKMRHSVRFVVESQTLSAPARIAQRLLVLSQDHGLCWPASRREIRIRQSQLSAMLGLSRKTVNQSLRGLHTDGVIKAHYSHIEILDLPRLEASGRGLA